MKWYAFNEVYETLSSELNHNFQPYYQADGSVLALTDAGNIVRMTGSDLSTWTTVVSGATCFFVTPGPSAGEVYVCYTNNITTGVSSYKKSTNYGASWSNISSLGSGGIGTANGRICLDMFRDANYAYTIVYDLNNNWTPTFDDQNIYIYRWLGTGWTQVYIAVMEPGQGLIDGAACKGFYNNNRYHFIANKQNGCSFHIYPSPPGFPPFPGYQSVSNTYKMPFGAIGGNEIQPYAMIGNEDISFQWENSQGVAYVSLGSIASGVMFYTTNGGKTWSNYSNLLYLRPIPDQFRQSSDVHHWMIEINNKKIHYYDPKTDHFYQYAHIRVPTGYQIPIIAGNFIFLEKTTGTGEKIQKYSEYSDIIADAVVEKWATEKPNEGRMVVPVEYQDYFNIGDIIELYDSSDILVHRGRVQQPVYGEREGALVIDIPGLDTEFYKKTRKKYVAQNTRQILIDLIDTFMKFHYQNNSIDPNTDFSLTYTREVRSRAVDTFHFARELERCVIYKEPGGLIHVRRYDRLVSSGKTFDEDNSILVQNNPGNDGAITISTVIGGWNRGGEVYKVYEPDPARTVLIGPNTITHNDEQIVNHNECNQLAVNRFNIYGVPVSFYRLWLGQNVGYVQEGKTVSYSYSDTKNGIYIASGNYLVFHYVYDVKNDYYPVFDITSGIVTMSEFNTVLKNANRDDDMLSTFTQEETQSTANNPLKYKNPLNRLAIGTYVPRRPAPTVNYDWYWNGTTANHLPAAGGEPNIWNTVDCSSIVPEGARAIDLKVLIIDGTPGSYMLFNEDGLSNIITAKDSRIVAPVQLHPFNLIVPITEARKFEWRSNILRQPAGPPPVNGWDQYYIVICGWWL